MTAPPPLAAPVDAHGDPSTEAPRPGVHPGDVLALLLVSGWIAFMSARIAFGFDLTDEGMYLSVTDHLVHGGVPFRDSQENPLRPFDVLLSCFWRPFGGFDLIAARRLGIFLQIAQMVALWAVIRRWRGPVIAAVAAGIVPCTPLLGIWSPGYNDLSCSAAVVLGACLALGSSARTGKSAIIWGLGGGIAWGIATFSYLPAIALAVVPAAMVAWGIWHGSRRHPWVRCGGATLAVALALCAIAVLVTVVSGLGADLLAASRDTVSQQNAAMPFQARLSDIASVAPVLGEHLVFLVAALLLLRWLSARRGTAATAPLMALVIALFTAYVLVFFLSAMPHLTQGTLFTDIGWVRGMWWGEAVIGLAGIAVCVAPQTLPAWWRARADASAGVAIALLVIIAYGCIQALVSSNGIYHFLHVRTQLLACAVAGIAGVLLPRPTDARSRLPEMTGIAALTLFGGVAGAAAWHNVYVDAPSSGCTATFTREPLAGVRSNPRMVAGITGLQTWAAANLPATAGVICYHDVPGLYFILGLRPVLDWTWTGAWSQGDPDLSDAFQAALLKRMVERGKNPDFCIRSLEKSNEIQATPPIPYPYRLSDPLHVFVTTHFIPVWRQWPYEVLAPRTAATPFQVPALLIDLTPGPLAPTTPTDPAVRFSTAPGTTLSYAPDGGLVLAASAEAVRARGAQPILLLMQYGGDETTLRLRVESDETDLTVQLVQGLRCATTRDRSDGRRLGPGWDVTFPAGEAAYRGFAIGRPPTPETSQDGERIVFHRLSLGVFPAIAEAPPR